MKRHFQCGDDPSMIRPWSENENPKHPRLKKFNLSIEKIQSSISDWRLIFFNSFANCMFSFRLKNRLKKNSLILKNRKFDWKFDWNLNTPTHTHTHGTHETWFWCLHDGLESPLGLKPLNMAGEPTIMGWIALSFHGLDCPQFWWAG